MAREAKIIPDLFFPDYDQRSPVSDMEGKGRHGREPRLEGGETVDLTPEGFIPIHRLTLGDLPKRIRTEEHLQFILDIAKDIVKINNNGLSEKRPDDDEFKRRGMKMLCGSGCILTSKDKEVLITTNRHVLFNEEELRQSTFDIFYDHHFGDPDDKKKRFKRCVRTNGECFFGKFSEADIAFASYKVKDAMSDHIKEHCLDEDGLMQHHFKLVEHLDFADDLNRPHIVCLISHPFGQPKHVSFGEMVDYDMQSRTIHHTAPSKEGSSGGRVIVFSMPLFPWYIIHVGTELVHGKRYKYARVQDMELSSSDLSNYFQAFPTKRKNKHKERETTLDESYEIASACVEIASLAAYVPLFGAFLLHTEETCLAGLDKRIFRPCKKLESGDSLTSHDLKGIIQQLAQLAPNFNVFPSGKLDHDADLVSLLEHSGPCFCQSVVEIMERGLKLGTDTATHCFLSPHNAAAETFTERSAAWPWGKGSNPDLRSDDAGENCLLKKCLELGHRDGIAVMLLLMIAKANVGIREFCFPSRTDSSAMNTETCESQWETIYTRTKQIHPKEQCTKEQSSDTLNPSAPTGDKPRFSNGEEGGDWHRLTRDVLTFIFPFLRSLSLRIAMGLFNKHQTSTSQREGLDDLSKLYTRCLALSEHAWHHERQVHPDTEFGGHGNSSGNCWCRCGRPAVQEVTIAHSHLLKDCISHHMATKGYPFSTEMRETENAARALQQLEEYTVAGMGIHFVKLLEALQDAAAQRSVPPGTVVLTALDKMEAFPRGRHSLMLFLASEEAFLNNFCRLAKHISRSLQPAYFAFPVSVFGRPGNWPGNVTPPEVQRTTWRLIEEAIVASGFCPALLLALQKDAERREKLIDLYVDLKQLKWERRIQPQLFGKYLAVSKRDMTNHLQTKKPFECSAHYIVWYAAFLVCPQIFASRSFVS